MNSLRCPFVFALAVVIAGVPVTPAVRAESPKAADNELIPLEPNVRVFSARGRTHAEVERQLGPPHHRVYPNLWVYWNCESDLPGEKGRSFDTMIITFVDGRLSSIRLAPRAHVEALIARVKAAKEAEQNRVNEREILQVGKVCL